MTIFLYFKKDSPRSLDAARRTARRFEATGVRCVSDAEGASLLRCESAKAAEAGLIAAVGGDGTMLGAAQLAISHDLPLFGINSGRVGFLCAFDEADIETLDPDDISALRESRRALIELVLPGESVMRYALNDIALMKTNYSKTVEFELFNGESRLASLRADGVIISTPTGSTGYSLSAGGPITDPELRALIVTPICAHSLFSRSHVLSGAREVRVVPARRFANEMSVSADGADFIDSLGEEGLSVRLSERTLSLLVSEKRGFYELLYREISGGI